MSRSRKIIGAVWMLIGLAIAALTFRDIATAGAEELVRSPSLIGAIVLALLLAVGCIFLGNALWLKRHSARRLGVVLASLFSVGFVAYGAANAFVALRAQHAISVVAVIGAIVGLAFCIATFRLAKQISVPSLSE